MIDGYRQHGSPLTDKQISDFQNAFGTALSAGALPKAIALAAPKAIGWALMNPAAVVKGMENLFDALDKSTPASKALGQAIDAYDYLNKNLK